MASKFFSRKKDGEQKEMTFLDHLEALRWHILRAAIAVMVGSAIMFIKMDFIFETLIMGPSRKEFISYKWLCKVGHLLGLGERMCMGDIQMKLQSTVMSEQFMMTFSIGFIGGLILAFPYMIWELWRFVKPALSSKEVKRTRGIVLWVSLLFFTGVLFGYFIIAPYTINFFASYKLSALIETRPTISDYIDNITQIVLGTGLVFQLPLVVYFLSKIGLITPAFLRKYRKFALVIILIVAAIITPADIMSQLIVTIPLWILYEVSIGISGRVAKQRAEKDKQEWS
jgi:sec-independent protein translocase protein TatC